MKSEARIRDMAEKKKDPSFNPPELFEMDDSAFRGFAVEE